MLLGIEVKVINAVKLTAAQGGRYDVGNSCRRVSAIPCCRQPDRHRIRPRGLVRLGGSKAARRLDRPVSRILTGVTGFPLAPFGLDPPRVVGIILLVLMAAAVVGLYVFHLASAWRWIYVVAAVMSLYLNCFVGLIQAFQKLAFLHALAPTQSEPPFVIAQVALLVTFVVLGVLAVIRFPPGTEAVASMGVPKGL
jgi:hypothetical protein